MFAGLIFSVLIILAVTINAGYKDLGTNYIFWSALWAQLHYYFFSQEEFIALKEEKGIFWLIKTAPLIYILNIPIPAIVYYLFRWIGST